MRALIPALALAILATIGPGRATDAQAGEADPSPLQVIADITLIDSRCHGVTVYYDTLFRYGEDHEIAATSILPLGSRRKAFEAAMAWRLASSTPNELCTDVMDRAADAAPGVIKRS